jgi:hypothetical protein
MPHSYQYVLRPQKLSQRANTETQFLDGIQILINMSIIYNSKLWCELRNFFHYAKHVSENLPYHQRHP